MSRDGHRQRIAVRKVARGADSPLLELAHHLRVVHDGSEADDLALLIGRLLHDVDGAPHAPAESHVSRKQYLHRYRAPPFISIARGCSTAYMPRYRSGSISAIRRMMVSVPSSTASFVSRSGRGSRNGSPNLTWTVVRWKNARGSFPPSVPQIATGWTGVFVRIARSAVPGSPRPNPDSPMRVPSGNMPSISPRWSASSERRNARRSARKRRTGMHPNRWYSTPTTGMSNSSCLPIQTMRRGIIAVRMGGSARVRGVPAG